MGGTMWVESEMGVGTTFHFTIKAEPSGELTPAARRMELSDPGLQKPARADRRRQRHQSADPDRSDTELGDDAP